MLMSDVANGARFGVRVISALAITLLLLYPEIKCAPKRAPVAISDISPKASVQ